MHPLYGYLLPVEEKHIRKSFLMIGLLLPRPVVYEVVSEHISDYLALCDVTTWRQVVDFDVLRTVFAFSVDL